MPRTSAPRWRRIALPGGSIRSSPPPFVGARHRWPYPSLLAASRPAADDRALARALPRFPGRNPRDRHREGWEGARRVPFRKPWLRDTQPVERARVRAALRAAALRSEGPLVLAALRA